MCRKLFTDKMDRKIELVVENFGETYSINSYYNDCCIGSFLYRETETLNEYDQVCYNYTLYNMNIKQKYQHSGIGTEIIRFGEEYFESVSYPNAFAERKGDHYASEGLLFMQHCIDIGVIDSRKIYFEYEEDHEERMEREYLEYLMETEKEDIE